jgi:glycosyltransferase involved in cell wall biosynthesis
MLISIIIPFYNRAHCIARALNSIKVQGISNIEVILGDDASTDGTVEVVKACMPDAIVFRKPKNQGASAARNAALKHAKGDFIAFLDSDDEWLSGKLAHQVRFLEEHPEIGLCGTGHTLMCRDGSRVNFPGLNPSNWRRELHMAESFHGASTSVVRRSILQQVGFFDEQLRVLEDWDWLLRISKVTSIHVLSEVLTVIHENNPSDPDHTLGSLCHFLEKHQEEFLEFGTSNAANARSQHYENAARCFLRNDRTREGCALLWRSWLEAPMRNPRSLTAFPIAALDFIASSKLLPRLLAERGRRRLTEPMP